MSYEFDEKYSVYNERRRVARKPHACDACEEPIAPGHAYWSIHIVFDGAETVKRCERCQALHKHLRDKGDGCMWPEEKLDCGQAYEDEWSEPPPAHIAALAFLLPGEPIPEPKR